MIASELRLRGVAWVAPLLLVVFMTTRDDLHATGQPPAAGSNRLAGATSPYLLQHKDNPVDWYAWGPEALEAARKQDRPIFLSIGYSACHWCHVMEEESFEDPNTAALMNSYFINIKVDREERPDLDDIYMTAVQMLTGSGGWPMSVWLTPELKPFFGGTYFPKDSRYGRPSFSQILTSLGEAWVKDRESLRAQAERVHEAVVQYMSGRRSPPGGGSLSKELIERAIADMTADFDHVNGGFGQAPKFPPHRALLLMLARYRETKDENLVRMATLTLDRMARGGMYDQVGGGFHRYSTDGEWLVPHFEKMLYDNALLADAYIDAWQTTGSEMYRRIVQEIFEWVLREMTDPAGAFYATLDADSEGEEGRFYVWKPEEVLSVLGPGEGALFNECYGITPRGNFEGGASIPHLKEGLDQVAARKGVQLPALVERLDAARAKLLAARAKRVRPHLDDKILTAWNGLMIAALARGSRALDQPRFRDAAVKAADFILAHAMGDDGLLRVSFRRGKLNSEKFLDDQAFFLKALVELFSATGQDRWLQTARSMVRATNATFWDPGQGGYYFSAPDRKDLIVRGKNPTDGAIPSGNSVMAGALLGLHRITGEEPYRGRAEETLRAFSGGMEVAPGAYQNMLAALDEYLTSASAAPAPPVVALEVVSHGSQGRGEERVAASLILDIKRGWHINSAKPTLPHLIPTSVSLNPDSKATLEKAEYPEGRMVRFGFAASPLSVYEGRQQIRLALSAPAAAMSGPTTIRGTLTYQACNDTACLLPIQAPFSFQLLPTRK